MGGWRGHAGSTTAPPRAEWVFSCVSTGRVYHVYYLYAPQARIQTVCDEKEGRKEEGKERKEEEERKRERERGKGGRREGGEKEKLGAAGACTGGKQGVLDHVRALLPKVVLRGPGHTEYISRKHCQKRNFLRGLRPSTPLISTSRSLAPSSVQSHTLRC